MLAIHSPESPGAPVRVTAEFYDFHGNPTLILDENEYKLNPESWDIKTKGTCITFRIAPRRIALRIRLQPDAIFVEHLSMRYRGVEFKADSRQVCVGSSRKEIKFSGSIDAPDVGIQINACSGSSSLSVREKKKRVISLHGKGGDYKIMGKGPLDTDIFFQGPARKLTVDADAQITVGPPPTESNYGLQTSDPHAARVLVGDLDVLVGVGARRNDLIGFK